MDPSHNQPPSLANHQGPSDFPATPPTAAGMPDQNGLYSGISGSSSAPSRKRPRLEDDHELMKEFLAFWTPKEKAEKLLDEGEQKLMAKEEELEVINREKQTAINYAVKKGKELDALQQKHKAFEKKSGDDIRALNEQVKSLTDSRDTMEKQLEDLRQKTIDVEKNRKAEVGELNEKLLKSQDIVSKRDQENVALQESNDKLQKTLNDALKKNAELEKEKKAAGEASERAIADVKKELKESMELVETQKQDLSLKNETIESMTQTVNQYTANKPIIKIDKK